MPTEPDLSDIFWQLARTHAPIKLINSYKGMPISNDAVIEEVGRQSISISAPRYQISCLYISRETYIFHEALPDIIRAEVVKLNAASQKAVLADFRPAQSTIGRRSQVRVEPENPLPAQIQVRKTTASVPAVLMDLSTEGLGIMLDRRLFHPHVFQPGVELDVTFTLPEQPVPRERVTQPLPPPSVLSDRFSREQIRGVTTGSLGPSSHLKSSIPHRPDGKVNVRGKIVKIRPEPLAIGIRVGINLFFNESARLVLTQYISRRQTELIREINSLYEGLCRLNNPG